MSRAAIYARYSSDNQRRTSTEDQIRNGRSAADRQALAVEAVYSDEEVSAYTPIERRAGSGQLMRDAAAGRWSVLVIEALDRFSRNLVDQERMVRRLEHRGVRIIGYADGYDSKLEGREFFRQVRGSFNEQALRDIGKKTHRGLDGQVERGYHAGGLSYGYRSVVAGLDTKGEPIGHQLEVDQAEAEHVRWIFDRFAAGWSCQRIASDLNRRAIAAPRGGTWAVSALYGSPAKGSGVLNNRLYVGEYVWNRSRWVKDPDTGRRQRVDRPPSEWKVLPRPGLAIVPADLWQAARRRMDRPRIAGGARGKGPSPRTLFGGLLQCGQCGGAVVAVSGRAYGCAARKDRGPHVCPGVLVPRRQLEARLLSTVRDELLSDEAVALVQVRAQQIIAEARRERERWDAKTRARRQQLEREVANLADAVAQFGISEVLRARLGQAEQALQALRPAPAVGPDQAPAGLASRYKRLVADLRGALERDIPRARELLREAFGPLRMVNQGEEVYVEFEQSAERLLLLAAGGSTLGMVAGTRSGTQKRVRVR